MSIRKYGEYIQKSTDKYGANLELFLESWKHGIELTARKYQTPVKRVEEQSRRLHTYIRASKLLRMAILTWVYYT